MSKPYDQGLINQSIRIAEANNYRVHKGVCSCDRPVFRNTRRI